MGIGVGALITDNAGLLAVFVGSIVSLWVLQSWPTARWLTVLLDHLVYGAPILADAVDDLEVGLGVGAGGGGAAPRNRNPQRPARPRVGHLHGTHRRRPRTRAARFGRPFGLDALDHPRVIGWALRCDDIDDGVARGRERGYDPGDPFEMQRTTADGGVLVWRLTLNALGGGPIHSSSTGAPPSTPPSKAPAAPLNSDNPRRVIPQQCSTPFVASEDDEDRELRDVGAITDASPLLRAIINLAAFHREHEKFYAASPREPGPGWSLRTFDGSCGHGRGVSAVPPANLGYRLFGPGGHCATALQTIADDRGVIRLLGALLHLATRRPLDALAAPCLVKLEAVIPDPSEMSAG